MLEEGLEAEVGQARMVVGTAAERPMIETVGLADRQIIDAGMTARHQPVFIELPILVAI